MSIHIIMVDHVIHNSEGRIIVDASNMWQILSCLPFSLVRSLWAIPVLRLIGLLNLAATVAPLGAIRINTTAANDRLSERDTGFNKVFPQ